LSRRNRKQDSTPNAALQIAPARRLLRGSRTPRARKAARYRASPRRFLGALSQRPAQPEARGVFAGLASWQSIGQMIRAIYEGVAFEHRAHIDHLPAGRQRQRAAERSARASILI